LDQVVAPSAVGQLLAFVHQGFAPSGFGLSAGGGVWRASSRLVWVVVHNRLMKTRIVTIMAVLAMQAAAAQNAADAALLRMQDAYRKNQTLVLSQTLPQVRGHVLEPMAAYWEMRVRLESAPVEAITARLAALKGSYWEDRLRADWLASLARREQWALFDAQWPLYRMRDERGLMCSASLRQWQRGEINNERAAAEVGRHWLAQRDIDQGCAHAARTLLASAACARSRCCRASAPSPLSRAFSASSHSNWAISLPIGSCVACS
jgi:hypothetical protein